MVNLKSLNLNEANVFTCKSCLRELYPALSDDAYHALLSAACDCNAQKDKKAVIAGIAVE
jgi:hypothetical protein